MIEIEEDLSLLSISVGTEISQVYWVMKTYSYLEKRSTNQKSRGCICLQYPCFHYHSNNKPATILVLSLPSLFLFTNVKLSYKNVVVKIHFWFIQEHNPTYLALTSEFQRSISYPGFWNNSFVS